MHMVSRWYNGTRVCVDETGYIQIDLPTLNRSTVVPDSTQRDSQFLTQFNRRVWSFPCSSKTKGNCRLRGGEANHEKKLANEIRR